MHNLQFCWSLHSRPNRQYYMHLRCY